MRTVALRVGRRGFSTAIIREAITAPVRRTVTAAERAAGVLSEESVAAAADSLHDNGAFCLEGALDVAWIENARAQAGAAFERCLSRPYPGGELAVGMEHGYAEVVHRAKGRYDVLDGINGEPLFAHGAEMLAPVIRRVLGDDAHMLFNGLLMTISPSGEQLWHADGEHLFSNTHPDTLSEGGASPEALPAHCINVFVPLVDLTLDNGVTEFCLGTHTDTGISPEIVWQKQSWRDQIGHTASPVAMTAPAGSVVLFDYRVLHRGLECKEGQPRRPVLYYTFARRWFSDNLNFPRRAAPALVGAGATTPAPAAAAVAGAGPLDMAAIRRGFPALAASDALVDGATRPMYLDGPGGTQVHGAVIGAMGDALAHKMSNIGYEYASSLRCLDLVQAARDAAADFLRCEGREVVFGPSMTVLAFDLATALAPSLGADDDVYLSRSEHDANVSPWLAIAQARGCRVRWLDLRPDDCTLDLDSLEAQLRQTAAERRRPALLALGAASNATGTMHDVRRAVGLAKAAGAPYTIVDAVHYAPHHSIDVQTWGCDFAFTSAYKWFGPHMSLMYGRAELLSTLPSCKVRPATDELPTAESYQLSRWERGTLNFESLAGVLAAVEYVASLGVRYGGAAEAAPRRARLEAGFGAIGAHEAALTARFLAGCAAIPGLKVYGLGAEGRCPTFAMRKEGGASPEAISATLSAQGIMATYGNFYAVEVEKALGLDQDGGLLRVGFMHYTTAEEVDRLLAALAAA